MNKDRSDIDIEKMIAELALETEALLVEHMLLLKTLSQKLAVTGSLDASTVASIGEAHGLSVQVKEEGFLKIAPYGDRLGS